MLMSKFYTELKRGTPPLEALRAAQLHLYANGPKTIAALERSAPTFKGALGPKDVTKPSKDSKETTASTR